MNDETSLMPAGRGELAHVTGAANSLVARGLVEIRTNSTEVEIGLPGLIGLYERPATLSRPVDGWWKGWERVKTPPLEELRAGVCFRLRVSPGYVYKAELSRVAQKETLSLLPRFDSSLPIWSLEMRKNRGEIAPQGFEHIGNLTRLCELDLYGAESLNEYALEFLHRLPSLQFLNLEGCLVGGEVGLAHIGALRQLRELNLSERYDQRIEGLRFLKGLQNLEWLSLYAASITDGELLNLHHLQKLSHLTINGPNVGLRFLKGLPNLEALNFYGELITDSELRHLFHLQKLSHLTLQRSKVSIAARTDLQAVLPKCEIRFF